MEIKNNLVDMSERVDLVLSVFSNVRVVYNFLRTKEFGFLTLIVSLCVYNGLNNYKALSNQLLISRQAVYSVLKNHEDLFYVSRYSGKVNFKLSSRAILMIEEFKFFLKLNMKPVIIN